MTLDRAWGRERRGRRACHCASFLRNFWCAQNLARPVRHAGPWPATLVIVVLIYLANIAYVLMLFAFVTRDVLRLRSLLVVAQSVVVIYAWNNGVLLVASWNGLFALINLLMVILILRERRAVEVPAELRDLHRQHFAALSPAEFMRWWDMGEDDIVHDRVLLLAGMHPQWLYFILSGTVCVERPGAGPLEIPAGHLVGEMSLLTGHPANADVHAVGRVAMRRWATNDLHQLRQRKPAVWAQIQSVIGFDLVQKIQRGQPARVDAVAAPS